MDIVSKGLAAPVGFSDLDLQIESNHNSLNTDIDQSSATVVSLSITDGVNVGDWVQVWGSAGCSGVSVGSEGDRLMAFLKSGTATVLWNETNNNLFIPEVWNIDCAINLNAQLALSVIGECSVAGTFSLGLWISCPSHNIDVPGDDNGITAWVWRA